MISLALLLLFGGVFGNVIRTENNTDRCEKVGANFFKSLEGAVVCVGNHLGHETNDSSSSEELCDYHTKNVRECFNDIIETVKECLEPEEKYLPEFIFNAIDGLLTLICADNSLEAALEKPSASKCVDDVFNDSKFLNTCFDNISLQSFDSEKDIVLREEELCQHMQTLYNCYDNLLRKRCSYDREVRKVLKKVHKAISSKCKAEGPTIANPFM